MEFLDVKEETGQDVMMGIGAGLKGVAAGTIKRFLPGFEISDDIAALALGYIGKSYLAKDKGSSIHHIARGLMIAGIAGLVEEATAGGLGGLFGGAPAAPPTETAPSIDALAASAAMGGA